MANAIEQIYDQLTTVFGGTNPNQIFAMLMPGTTLDASLYAYDTTKRKPATVMEAESKLADQMFDIAKVSGSANGQRVSSQYLQALSVLVPEFNPMIPAMKNTLRNFINTPMPESTLLDGKPFVGSLAEYYFKLYEGWIAAKEAWETKIIEKKDELHKDPDTECEKFLEWYEQVAEGELAKIDEAMGKVLSVFSPTDMDAILGALAVGPGGELDEAANIVRDIRLESPNGGFLYPVDLVPGDWFRMLASDLDPVDLLKDPEFIAASISAKRKALQASLSQIQALIDQLPPADAVKQAAQALSEAQAKYTAAQNALTSKYADNVLSAVQIALALAFPEAGAAEAVEKGAKDIAKVKEEGGSIKVGGKVVPLPTDRQLTEILNGYKSLISAQSDLLTSSQAVANAGLDLASAKAANYKGLPVLLSRIQAQLADIQTIQGQLIDKASAPSNVPDIKIAPNRDKTFADKVNAVVTAATGETADKVKQAVDGKVSDDNDPLKPLKAAADAAAESHPSAHDVLTAVSDAKANLEKAANEILSKAQNAKASGGGALSADDVKKAVNEACGDKPEFGALKNAATGDTPQNVIDAVNTAVLTLTSETGTIETNATTASDKDKATALSVKNAVDGSANISAYPTLKAAADNKAQESPTTPTAQDVIDAVKQAANALLGTPTAKQSDASARFMDLQFSFSSSEMKKDSSTDTSFSQSSWSVDLFFGSASGSSSTSSAVSSDHAFETNTEIKIGLKAAKVDIQRGWFEPGIFKLAADMDRLSTEPVSYGALPVTLDGGGNPMTDWSSNTLVKFNKALLPAYPVAFVVVKDVTISFQASASQTDALHTVLDSRAAAGGGFLCFSASSSSASSSDHSALSSKSTGNVFTIHIPGAQILGWFLEFVPEDKSKTLQIQANPEKADELTIISFVNKLASLNPKKPDKPSVT
jgi:hypothetical protein